MGVGAFASNYTVKGLSLLRKYGIDPNDVDGGNIKIKAVGCGKVNCKTCPHAYYAYHRNRWGEKYLGVCDKDGNPRKKYKEIPKPLKQTKIPGIA